MTLREQPRISPVKRVPAPPAGTKAHAFTLRDDNQRHYHRSVKLSESPFYVALGWRANSESPVHQLGTFRLDLAVLLASGHVRPDRPGDAFTVRVRFYRADDGGIYLQSRLDTPRLRVADAPV